MVNFDHFFENYRIVKPFLININPLTEKERIQSPLEREKFDDATKCILCAACFSACPIENEKNPAFIGPAAIYRPQDSCLIQGIWDLRTGSTFWINPMESGLAKINLTAQKSAREALK